MMGTDVPCHCVCREYMNYVPRLLPVFNKDVMKQTMSIHVHLVVAHTDVTDSATEVIHLVVGPH